MAMAWVWTVMAAAAVIFGALTGRMAQVGAAALEGARSAVELCLSMAGVVCLWTGVMEVMERCGLAGGLARLLRPALRRILPQASRDGETLAAVSANVSANLLGLGNAATPLGIRAARRMAAGCDGVASDELCRLVVLNTASIQLLPTTVAGVRLASGAAAPFDILPAVWLASALSVVVGVLTAKFLAAVGGGVDGLMLQLLGILIGDPIRRRQLLPEHCRHILNGDAVLAGRHRTHAPARHRVARKLGALAFEQIRQLHAERQRALVHERKREIDRALLIAVILLDADLGLLCHLRFAVADDLAHLADSLCDLHQRVGSRLLGLHHHSGFLLC